MPSYRDITVEIVDHKNNALTEWGVRKRDRARLITCYIQSKTDMAFAVRLTPRLLSPTRSVDSEQEHASPSDNSGESMEDGEIRDRAGGPPNKPWQLLATLRLDGRKDYEKRSIIYLDPTHHSSDQVHGVVTMRTRNIRDANGQLRECGWIFQEVGIDAFLDKLQLSGEHDAVPLKSDDDLLAAFGTLKTDLTDTEEKTSVGQIEITLERVVVKASTMDFWRSRREDSDNVEMSPGDLSNISHTVARNKGKERGELVKFIEYNMLDASEPPYAVFRFYYRSEDHLRKFNFPGFLPKSTPSTGRAERKKALSKAAASPLSILNQKPKRYFKNEKGEIIAVEDVPVIDLTESNADEANSANKPWSPKHNRLRTITIIDDSPPNSPTREIESEAARNVGQRQQELTGSASSSPSEAEQSSADGSPPLKRGSSKPLPQAMLKFRMLDGDGTTGDDGDDEASTGSQASVSASIHDQFIETSDENDDGVNRNEADQGISDRLDKVEIGSKRTVDGEGAEDESASTYKKIRTDGTAAQD